MRDHHRARTGRARRLPETAQVRRRYAVWGSHSRWGGSARAIHGARGASPSGPCRRAGIDGSPSAWPRRQSPKDVRTTAGARGSPDTIGSSRKVKSGGRGFFVRRFFLGKLVIYSIGHQRFDHDSLVPDVGKRHQIPRRRGFLLESVPERSREKVAKRYITPRIAMKAVSAPAVR